MKLSDAADGDVVRIKDQHWRLMIKGRDGFLCRPRLALGWGQHVWITNDTEIDEIVKVQPKRNPRARKAKGNEDDPIAWQGTQRIKE